MLCLGSHSLDAGSTFFPITSSDSQKCLSRSCQMSPGGTKLSPIGNYWTGGSPTCLGSQRELVLCSPGPLSTPNIQVVERRKAGLGPYVDDDGFNWEVGGFMQTRGRCLHVD